MCCVTIPSTYLAFGNLMSRNRFPASSLPSQPRSQGGSYLKFFCVFPSVSTSLQGLWGSGGNEVASVHLSVLCSGDGRGMTNGSVKIHGQYGDNNIVFNSPQLQWRPGPRPAEPQGAAERPSGHAESGDPRQEQGGLRLPNEGRKL